MPLINGGDDKDVDGIQRVTEVEQISALSIAVRTDFAVLAEKVVEVGIPVDEAEGLVELRAADTEVRQLGNLIGMVNVEEDVLRELVLDAGAGSRVVNEGDISVAADGNEVLNDEAGRGFLENGCSATLDAVLIIVGTSQQG